MNLTETIKATPIVAEKSLRRDQKRVLTSSQAGKIVPLAYVPLLREDRVSRGRMTFNIQMAETAEMLMNAVNVTVYAHFIPYLAFERFNGMDSFNRSYKGEPEREGEEPIPFFINMPYNRDHEINRALGIHSGDTHINRSVTEAYNVMVNHRRKARSTKLPERDILDTTLAPAFWQHTDMAHIVPDFDQAMIDGEVELNFAGGQLPVTGIGTAHPQNWFTHGQSYRETGSSSMQYPSGTVGDRTTDPGLETNNFVFREDPNNPGFPGIFAELAEQGVKLSLSNIELAKKTAAFAKMRSEYAGLDDDHLIDLLMEGIRVPEAALTQPILLDRKRTIMGYNQRYATDSGNLDKSVTNGLTTVDINVRTPAMNTGGIILITCEIVPEQLFERKKDYFLAGWDATKLPSFTRDYLDPEKVSVVTNSHVDVLHTDPDGTFGYAPLNHEWQRNLVNIGGKYFRPEVDATFDEDRQKLWAVETVDPTLTEDFYMASALHQKVFADTTADAFEYTGRGVFEIVGNTVFGKRLKEDTDDYETITEQVDTSRINQGQ